MSSLRLSLGLAPSRLPRQVRDRERNHANILVVPCWTLSSPKCRRQSGQRAHRDSGCPVNVVPFRRSNLCLLLDDFVHTYVCCYKRNPAGRKPAGPLPETLQASAHASCAIEKPAGEKKHQQVETEHKNKIPHTRVFVSHLYMILLALNEIDCISSCTL